MNRIPEEQPSEETILQDIKEKALDSSQLSITISITPNSVISMANIPKCMPYALTIIASRLLKEQDKLLDQLYKMSSKLDISPEVFKQSIDRCLEDENLSGTGECGHSNFFLYGTKND